MHVSTYISFNGNCREAVEFYASVFETGKPKFCFFSEIAHPEHPFSDEIGKRVAHVRLDIGEACLMFSDLFPDMPFDRIQNVTLAVAGRDIPELETLFDKLKEGGKVLINLQETFWNKRHGLLVDKFGVPWQFSHVQPEEEEERSGSEHPERSEA